jgi:hypothetical protein
VSWRDELPVPDRDPGAVREAAEDILSRPEYRERGKSLIDRVNEWLGEAMGDLLELVGLGGGAVSAAVAYLFLLGLVVGVGFLVWWAVRSFAGGGGGTHRSAGEPVIVETDEHRSSRDWRSEAERHEAEGRWRDGLLCRYRSLVVDLVEREVIPDQVGRTAGEYVADVRRHHPEGAAAFTAATDLFEGVWYGGADAGPAERDRFVGLAADVLAARDATAGREVGVGS